MKISVLIEPVAGNGYRARNGEPFDRSAEGATEEEAVRKLQELIRGKLSTGVRLLQVELPEPDNPWLQMAGTLDLNDPLVKEWIEIMEENRRKADEDPDYLRAS
jgi:predicted RNase H-like HicB family nuclease